MQAKPSHFNFFFPIHADYLTIPANSKNKENTMLLAKTGFIMTISLIFAFTFMNVAQGQDVTSHEFGGHTYLIVNEPTTWTNAQAVAENSLGYLAIINSEPENQFIYNNLIARNIDTTAPDGGSARYAWLGASDAVAENTWLWVNGTNFNTGYTKWGSGWGGSEPDNYLGAQNYLAMGLEDWPLDFPGAMGYASQWNDISGTNQLAYIIEFDSPTLDTDEDGQTDWEEFIAATDPTNATSQLKLNITSPTANNFVLSWSGAAECSYTLETKTNLLQSAWTIATNFQSGSSTMTYTNTTPETPIFYKISAER